MKQRKWLSDIFIAPRLFAVLAVCIILYVISFYIRAVWPIANGITIAAFFAILIDYLALFAKAQPIVAERQCADRWSNGDTNNVAIALTNNTALRLHVQIYDELPIQLQRRDLVLRASLSPRDTAEVSYNVTPTKRGLYSYGNVLCYVSTLLGLLQRRCVAEQVQDVKVLPSFRRVLQPAIKASAYVQDAGEHALTRTASSMEFDHIKEYVRGDDMRHMNWAASARRGQLMVNTYNEERSQQVYCVIDTGRRMKMPFEGLTLLEYSINSALMFANSVLHKGDKMGVASFGKNMGGFVKASRQRTQLSKVMETLYDIETDFEESNFAALATKIKYFVGQRSLILLYTNFESLASLQRQMVYLKAISRRHLLCTIVFENTDIAKIHDHYSDDLEGVYVKTIADKYTMEKKRMLKELHKEGIITIFTTPNKVGADVISKYLLLKKQGSI
jgi:uncharacterized protein (DUF58 family)